MSRKATLPISPDALFRYRVVSAVRALELGGLGRSAAVRLVAASEHFDELDKGRNVSERTIYRWLAGFADAGLTGLEPARRPKIDDSLVLDEKLLAFLRTERDQDRDASIPELLRRAEEKDVIADASAVDRTTVWRAMQRMGVPTTRRRQPYNADTRRFRYAERMQMVLVDFKHFRAGVTRAKRVAVYMLDDATRHGLGVRVTTSERPDVVLHLLDEVVRRYGLMSLLYRDGGAGFKDGDVLRAAANLGIHVIAGRPRYPEGHGAIERFNRSLKARELRTYDGAPHIDPDCGALTLRLRHDLFEVYNHLPHEAFGGETPHERWTHSARALLPATSEAWLRACFTTELRRRVSDDHTVQVGGLLYEIPRGHAGTRITLQRRLLERTPDEDALYFEHRESLVRLHPVDLAFNATSGRGSRAPDSREEPAPVPAKSASTLAFERTYVSMLGPDGGYPETDEED